MYGIILLEKKPVWSYSKDIPEEPLFVYFENKPVYVKMIIDDGKPLLISSVAPLSLKLGMAVFYIIKKRIDDNNGNWRSVFIGADGRPYKWMFYNKSFGMKTYFNPDETLIENKIKSKTVIIAKRIE